MNPGNDYYGHTSILARYCGLHDVSPVWGYIQHGWNPTTGVQKGAWLINRLPKFVWSTDNLASAIAHGMEPVHAIGAPFLYLGGGDDLPALEQAVGTIYYPFHGWQLGDVVGSHDRLAAEIRDREGDAATVCLYWREYRESEVRAAYESAGLRVITHGHRDDPAFLTRQREEILRHRRVATNRVATALMYGGWLFREIQIYGNVFGLQDAAEGEAFDRVQRSRWPDLFAGPVPAHEARAFASRELGAQHVRQPDDLRRLFRWGGVRRRLTRLVKPAFRASELGLEYIRSPRGA